MEEKTTLLEDLKKLEATKKKQVLAAVLNKIKDDALEVLKLKERYKLFMDQLGVSEKESKQIIDWINSLVSLTDSDKESLKKSVISELEQKRKTVEKKIEDAPLWNNNLSNLVYTGSNMAATNAINMAAAGTMAYCNTSNQIEVS